MSRNTNYIFQVFDENYNLIFTSKEFVQKINVEKALENYSLKNKNAVYGYIFQASVKPNWIATLLRSMLKAEKKTNLSDNESQTMCDARCILENLAHCEVIAL